MTDVSVLVPTFKRAGLLKVSLESILAQTNSPAEIIVIDDGSNDETETVVRGLSSDIEFIAKPENSGKAASLNLGIKKATGSLIWIMDDDDIALPHALETLTDLLDQNPDAGFAYGRHMRFSEDASGTRTELGTGYWQTCTPEDFLTQTLEDFFPHQPGMLIRKSLFETVGRFDADLKRSQDYEMLIRLARAAPCANTDDIVFLQRQHAGIRGTAGDRFAASHSNAKWMEYDQEIFRKLRDTLSLNEYLPRGETANTDAQKRMALLQRGVIFARKKLWELAIEDFETAAEFGPTSLTDTEKTLLRRTLASKYGCDEVREDPDIIGNLKKVKSIQPAGAAIVQGIMRGMRWRIREAIQTGQPLQAIGLVQRSLTVSLSR
ncbi:MAG: glycosyltransferase family 2 protein [Pseudomonadota bacterium]